MRCSGRAAPSRRRRTSSSPRWRPGEDIARLREAGFADRAVHDICAITGYYAFVNRIADGLGVELEPGR